MAIKKSEEAELDRQHDEEAAVGAGNGERQPLLRALLALRS